MTFVCEFFLCGLRHGFCSLDCQHFFFVELRGERPASCILTACSETHPKKTTSADISNQKLLLASADSARLRGSCSDFLHAGAHSMMHVTIFAYATFPTIDLCRAFHAPSMSCVCCVILARARSGEGALAESLHIPHDHDRTPGVVAGSFGARGGEGLVEVAEEVAGSFGARGGGARHCRAPPKVGPRIPFSLFFRARFSESSDFVAVCRALASAQKTPQNATKTTICHKPSNGRASRQGVDPLIFWKSLFGQGFAAFSARLQALGKQPQICAPRIPGPGNCGEKLSERLRDCGWRAACAPARSYCAPTRRGPLS